MNDITKLPLWEVCPECGGSGEHYIEVIKTKIGMSHAPDCDGTCKNCPVPIEEPCLDYDAEPCINCHGTGKIPIRYTPEKARDAGYEVRDDDPVWVYLNSSTQDWTLDVYEGWGDYGSMEGEYIILAIPGQGKPDKDWRCE